MSDPTTRRDFLLKACPAAALVALGFGAAGCDAGGVEDDPGGNNGGGNNAITLDLTSANASALAAAGGVVFLRSQQMIVLNVDGQTIRAFTNVCTHEGCEVDSFRNNRLVCPCHGSQYDTNGQVVAGPATRALREYPVTRDGNTVTIARS